MNASQQRNSAKLATIINFPPQRVRELVKHDPMTDPNNHPPSNPPDIWDQLEHHFGGPWPVFGLFWIIYQPLLFLDYALREAPTQDAVLRPSIGVLLVSLWFARGPRWLVLLALHSLAAVLAARYFLGPVSPAQVGLAVLPGAVTAIVAAAACRLLLQEIVNVRVSQVPTGIGGGVLGALCGAAVVGAIEHWMVPGARAFLANLSELTVEHTLGALATGPAALTWLHERRLRAPELELRSKRELAWLALATLAPVLAGTWLLRGPNSSLLPLPVVSGPALLLASLRLPPRWATTLAGAFVMSFSLLAASRQAPYSVADPAVRIGLQQMLAGIFLVVPLVLSVGIAQQRMTLSRLRLEQSRLQAYVKSMADADERTRRSVAVDLHDGIGQTLAGMQMMLDSALRRPPEAIPPLLGELAGRLHEVQDHTRRLITDLSPPGLYDLGLGAGLSWLSLRMREQNGLSVQLTCRVDESALSLEARVLAFKLVRELLRNVVRHSGVLEASVIAEGDDRVLRLSVSDKGCGFDGQARQAAFAGDQFGLWSITERIREFGGQLQVDSAPGRGARFDMEIPLGQG